MTPLESHVLRLFEARKAALVAKTARADLAAKIGNCKANLAEDSACFRSRLLKDHWCDICKAKLPLWEDFRRKADIAGAALRAVLIDGKRLSDKKEK